MSSNPPEDPRAMGDRQRALARLITPLTHATLARLAKAYRITQPRPLKKETLRQRLLAAPQIEAQEVLWNLLTLFELRRVCRGLGLRMLGQEPQLVRRIERSLRWRPFTEARAFARGLGLQSPREWDQWCKGPGRPADVPATPWQVYQDAGWKGLGDWLGTGSRANWRREFLPFEEAREYARALGLPSRKAWIAHCKAARRGGTLPAGIPAAPRRVYLDRGWRGYGDWLGTGALSRRRREFRSFEAARAFVRTLGLRSQAEWVEYSAGRLPEKGKRPPDIPSDPAGVYAHAGWQGTRDWLGTAVQDRYRAFGPARAVARSLGFRSSTEWRKWPDRPDDLPLNPHRAYREKGWRGWGDWLGTGNVSSHVRSLELLPFAAAREFARSLKLRSSQQWKVWLRGERPDLPKRPKTIPVAPSLAYAEQGWVDWSDWLGPTATPITQAQSEALREELRAWRARHGLSQPQVAELLGCGTTSIRNWEGGRARVSRRYAAAIRELVHESPEREEASSSSPEREDASSSSPEREDASSSSPERGAGSLRVPSHTMSPNPSEDRHAMEDGQGALARLLTPLRQATLVRIARAYRITPPRPLRNEALRQRLVAAPQIEAREVLANLLTLLELRLVCRGLGLSGDGREPQLVRRIKRSLRWRPFTEARAFARGLGLQSSRAWNQWRKGPDRPADIPTRPPKVYQDAGWRGWGDWLGTGKLHNGQLEFLPFEQAREFARSLGLHNNYAWKAWLRGDRPERPRRPESVPVDPSRAYAGKGWIDWSDWLGPAVAALSDDERRALGRQLRAWRERHGLTQPQVAKLLGCGVAALCTWERGRTPVSRRYAAAIRKLVAIGAALQ